MSSDPSSTGAAPNLRILLVEDVDMIAQVVEFLVQSAHCEFLRAHHGEEGVALATREQPDLILMDLQMPVMDGIEATRRIREWENTVEGHSHIPIYAFTAKGAVGQEAFCLEKGFDGFFNKPLPVRDFFGLVAKIQAQKSAATLSS